MHKLKQFIRPFRSVLKKVAIGASVLALTACGDLLQTEGTNWVDQYGNKIDLRGVNLGNWLAMEMWMFDPGQGPLGDGIVDQCTLEGKLRERFGQEEQEGLINQFRDSWLTEADWDQLAAAGFNLIRVPFLYDLIEDDANPKTLRSDAWEYLDWAIEEARKRDMYVILDLHGAPGRQGWEHHSGCAGKNELWDSEEYRDRTKWLWRKISIRYKHESTVAGYGLLNEPWGTDAQTLADFSVELHDVIRMEDDEHVVILPGHDAGGIKAYPHPDDHNMENIAYEIHSYPGIFGWGSIGYEVHRDWLTCGEDGTTGVCEWQAQLEERGASMLIGETQTWTGLGDIGGEITRASYDRYNELGWAVTGWSFKTTSNAGGTGNGVWGFVTNTGNQLLAKAETWSCNNWESTFANGCAKGAESVVPYHGEGSQTMYLAIKTGAFNGADVIYDELRLINDATGENIVSNGEFGSDAGWTESAIWSDERNYDFDYAAGEFAGSDTGSALRVSAAAGNNSVIYQAVTVEGGQSYTLSGKFADIGGNDMWSEVYLVPDMPVEGQEVDGRVLPSVDVNTSSIEEIESYFTSFATMDYEINEWVMASLTSELPATIFTTIPSTPMDLSLVEANGEVSLDWTASEGDVDGYRVYRSTSPNFAYSLIGSTTDTEYVDVGVNTNDRFFYYVTAFNAIDESYTSNSTGTDPLLFSVPGRLEAEDFVDAHTGIQVGNSGDVDGTYNIGWFEPGRWVEYNVVVAEAGVYTAHFRLASKPGADGFEVRIGLDVLASVAVPETEEWDHYETVDVELTLPAGEHTLQLYAISPSWNLNWVNFTTDMVTPTPTPTPGLAIPNPTIGMGGSNSSVAIVNDEEKGKDVVRLEVLSSGNVGNAYASVGFAAIDFTQYTGLQFDILDTQGANTANVTLTDADGNSWGAWTSLASAQNEWTTISVDYSSANIDLTRVVEINVAQWNSGVYFLSDFFLPAPAVTPTPMPTPVSTPEPGTVDLVMPTPEMGSGGSHASVTIVPNAEKDNDVISLEVLASNNVDQAYASVPFDATDLSVYRGLTVDILDTQGANTAFLTLVDISGASWSAWTNDPSVHNAWTTLSLDFSAADSAIDLTNVVEIRAALWNSGTYLLSDVTFKAQLPTGDTDFAFVNPTSGAGGINASITSVADAEKGKEVVSLEVLASGNIDEGYATITLGDFDELDLSIFASVEFDILDTQGANTAYVVFWDAAGTAWGFWTSDGAVHNEWTTIAIDLSMAEVGFDLTRVTHFTVAQWNSGTYYLSDVTLKAAAL